MNHSNNIVQFCDEVLNEKNCFELAKKTQFIQRSSSKLRGNEFIKAMILPCGGLSTDSLKGLSKRIKEINPEADLSSQALCERINSINAVNYIKAVLLQLFSFMQKSIKANCPKLEKLLGKFSSVLIEDSTFVTLNEKLQESFQGTCRSGGKGAKSQLKIDVIYDIMRSCTQNVEIHHGNQPDQGNANRILKHITKGTLVIRDLGYFTLESLTKIAELAAYFISRWNPNVKIYLNKDDKEPLDIEKYISENHRNHRNIEIPEVYLGEERLQSRLVIYRLPKEVIEKRTREANKRAKQTGRKLSERKKVSLKFAIFITNVPSEVLEAEVIGTIYRLRWEIELVFKRWKSQLEIDYLKGINSNRIKCLIWSRLCTVLIIEIITGHLTNKIQRILTNRELSHAKVIAYILRGSKFIEAVIKDNLEKYISEMEKDALRMLMKDKRERKTMRERVFNAEAYYWDTTADNQMFDYQQFALA